MHSTQVGFVSIELTTALPSPRAAAGPHVGVSAWRRHHIPDVAYNTSLAPSPQEEGFARSVATPWTSRLVDDEGVVRDILLRVVICAEQVHRLRRPRRSAMQEYCKLTLRKGDRGNPMICSPCPAVASCQTAEDVHMPRRCQNLEPGRISRGSVDTTMFMGQGSPCGGGRQEAQVERGDAAGGIVQHIVPVPTLLHHVRLLHQLVHLPGMDTSYFLNQDLDTGRVSFILLTYC